MILPSAWRLPVVAISAACLIMLVTSGVRAGFGLFLEPMSSDLGWGREIFALAIAIQNLMWGLGQPFAGALADRFGSARMLALGCLVYGVGLVIMAHTSTPLSLHLSAGILVGLGLAGGAQGIVLAAVTRLVPAEKQSWVLGVAMAAGSLGQFLMVPLGQAFLSAYGWSTALLLLSVCVFAVLPLSVTLSGGPNEQGLGRVQTIGEALREAAAYPSYWYLTAGFFVCGFHVTFIATHLPAYVSDIGLSPQIGAWALALVGLFNVAGAYFSGVLGGRYSKKYLLSFLYFGRSLVIAVFIAVPPSDISALLFAAFIGLLWLSTVPLTSGLVLFMFGPRYMATLFGIVFFSHQIGSFLGVWLGGYLFDSLGSYDIVWWISIALGLFAGLMHWPIKEQQVARLAQAR